MSPHHYLHRSSLTQVNSERKESSSSSSSTKKKKRNSPSKRSFDDSFLHAYFDASECDDSNNPPSFGVVTRSMQQLNSGSDVRGRFVDHPSKGGGATLTDVARSIQQASDGIPALTPFAAHCLGHAFAKLVHEEEKDESSSSEGVTIDICVGRDPRSHGVILSDAFCRGAQSVANTKVVYTNLASTPAMFDFCRSNLCDGGVMVTASHLPNDRNGFKFFTAGQGGFSKSQVKQLISSATDYARTEWSGKGSLPPRSGGEGVFCSEWVDYMPYYKQALRKALLEQVHGTSDVSDETASTTLSGLNIVVNPGNGAGCFFPDVLESLGADISSSLHTTPDPQFPAGIPNPEKPSMIDETMVQADRVNADIGILFDTDADRCGFVVPRTIQDDGTAADYEALNRNRLIALLGVIFSEQSPGCAIVTDSVTSNGLATFLQERLGLKHVRYLKGYNNVISKARELTKSGECNAEVAIETSGHCAMKENDYLDDGTYTAVKVVGHLAKSRKSNPSTSLLQLISDLPELDEVVELRMTMKDGSIESMKRAFDSVAESVETLCETTEGWNVDTENLEGIRISTGADGGFFMLRKSLHDPVMSLQVEASSKKAAQEEVVGPLLELFQSSPETDSVLDSSTLEEYKNQ